MPSPSARVVRAVLPLRLPRKMVAIPAYPAFQLHLRAVVTVLHLIILLAAQVGQAAAGVASARLVARGHLGKVITAALVARGLGMLVVVAAARGLLAVSQP
jgi:hypothetical protein